jgi:hypothetical protein
MNKSKILQEAGITNLCGVGFFYKHDKHEGFGIYAIEGQPLWAFMQDVNKTCEFTYKTEMKAIKNQEKGYQVSLGDFKLDTVNTLNALIPQFYKEVGFPDGKQPIEKGGFAWESTEDTYRLIMMICIQIYYLSQWGMIPDDQFNGMLYNYSNESLTIK